MATEVDRIQEIAAGLSGKLADSERRVAEAERRAEAAEKSLRARDEGLAAVPKDIREVRALAVIGEEGGNHSLTPIAWVRAYVDRRHVCSALLLEAIPFDGGGALFAELDEERAVELTFSGGRRPLYVALDDDALSSFLIWWAGKPEAKGHK